MNLGDGTYISLWPGEGKANFKKKIRKDKKQDNHTSVNLDEDIEEEGRDPDRTFKIDGLNENKIRRWWNGFNKASWSWIQNCCKTVIDGLREGGSGRGNLGRMLGILIMLIICSPLNVVFYCGNITQ